LVEAGEVGLRVRELGLRLVDVAPDRDAGVVAVLGDGQGALVGRHGGAVERDLGVGLAQAEVVGGEFALRRQPGRGEVRGAGLGVGPGAFDRAADSAPDVGLPAGADAGAVLGRAAAAATAGDDGAAAGPGDHGAAAAAAA